MREAIFVADPEYDALATTELQRRLSGALPSRTRATGALARRIGLAVLAMIDRETIVLGTVSLAHIALACIWIADVDARDQVRAIVDTWPEPDRTDLMWFLKSQDIDLATARPPLS